MADASIFRDYVKELQAAVSLGNATEHTHRPALQKLLQSAGDGIVATNEPKRVECGAPDYAVSRKQDSLIVGYVEAKDIGVSLHTIERDSDRAKPSTPNGRQFKRYRESLPNLLLTDYTELRWYVDGERRATAILAKPDANGRPALRQGGIAETDALLSHFLSYNPTPVASAQELARHLARLAHLVRDIVTEGFRLGQLSSDVSDLYQASKDVLVPDLSQDSFADMFAQTLAYGLFAARVNHNSGEFHRNDAARHIPQANPFIRRIFTLLSDPALDDEPFVGFVDDLAQLLGNADMEAVLSDFGKRTARQDPVLHFYETFLAAYDPTLRERRGVYYTPEPVVSYIVRSVDHILRQRFNCPDGLADHSTANYETLEYDGNEAKTVNKQSHRVLVLDPACGTGSFLYGVIDHIREHYRNSGNAGMWDGYVKDHLLPRLYGFELLMAPYAMAHLKLAMQLSGQDLPAESRADWTYKIASSERLGVYLTNSLEEGEMQVPLSGPYRVIADEANSATEIKRDMPIMVVLGNPPYSGHSANKGEWISKLIDDYKEGFPELRRPAQGKWLSDDYVKFIRFAQWRIEKSGSGILAFITNHAYLDNPTFRGMRRSLIGTFDEVYLLDLHGNSKKKERTPDGGSDENVFDIQQGVAIGIFVKRPGSVKHAVRVFHADLWGERQAGEEGGKYGWLTDHDVTSTQWMDLDPKAPTYLFVPRDEELLAEYEACWSIPNIFAPNGTPAPGIVTTHDQFAISWTRTETVSKVKQLLETKSEDEARSLWKLCSQDQWLYERAMKELQGGAWRDHVKQILYRPFDARYTVYDKNVAVHRRERVMRHMLPGQNLGLIYCRQTSQASEPWMHCGVTTSIHRSQCKAQTRQKRPINYLAPLYTYPSEQSIEQGLYQQGERQPNLAPAFTAELEWRLSMRFISDGKGDLRETFGPEDVFHYIYAMFHSPTYRERYDQFLRADFPRVPLVDNAQLFRTLAALGEQLTKAHLMESSPSSQPVANFPVSGDNVIEKGYPKYYGPGETPPGETTPVEQGRVYISANAKKGGKRGQYFEGIAPEVWKFRIGGYQPMDKWLKDRKGRELSFDDRHHYVKIAAAQQETIRLMEDVDQAIADSVNPWQWPAPEIAV